MGAAPLWVLAYQRVRILTLLFLVRLAPSPNRSLLPIAVQPSILTIHCKTLNNLIRTCYSLPVVAAMNPRPLFDSFRRHLSPAPGPRPGFLTRPANHARPPGSPSNSSKVFPSLPLTFSPTVRLRKSFSRNTYRSPRKCCKQKTYGMAKPFRCNTYKKQGGASFKPRVFLFLRRSLSLLFSLFAPRAKANPFLSSDLRTLSKNSRVYPNNSHFRNHPPIEHPPFFSITSVEPIFQPFCFDGLPSNGGVYPPVPPSALLLRAPR